MALNTRNE